MNLSLSLDPQKTVWIALLVSIISVLILSALAFRSLPDRTQTIPTPHFLQSERTRAEKFKLSKALLRTSFSLSATDFGENQFIKILSPS